MKLITSKNIAAALIAGLLILATVENHAAEEVEFNLDEALRIQVLNELKQNVRRLYETSRLVVPVEKNRDVSRRSAQVGFSIVGRKPESTRLRLDREALCCQ